MSIERMADRTLPLAERVQAAVHLAGEEAQTVMELVVASSGLIALLTDIAAADRLARAADGWFAAIDGWTSELSVNLRYADIDGALADYRARMAQGAGDA